MRMKSHISFAPIYTNKNTLIIFFICMVIFLVNCKGDESSNSNNLNQPFIIKNNYDLSGISLLSYVPLNTIGFQLFSLHYDQNNTENSLKIKQLSDELFSSSYNATTSYDGCNIIYYNYDYKNKDFRLMFMNQDGSNKQLLFSSKYYMLFPHSWHPDGKRILVSMIKNISYLDQQNIGLAEYYLDHGIFKLINNTSELVNIHGSYSPNGNFLAVSKRKRKLILTKDTYQDIYLIDLQNNLEEKIISSKFDDSAPVWSKDSKLILYSECKNVLNNDIKPYCPTYDNCSLKLFNTEKNQNNEADSDSILIDNGILSFNYFGKPYYDFSLDGNKIIYTKKTDECKHELYVQNFNFNEEEVELLDKVKISNHPISDETFFTGHMLNDIKPYCKNLPNNISNQYEENNNIKNTSSDNNYINTNLKNNNNTPFTSTEFIKVEAGAYNSCAIDIQSKLWCWGLNDSGQLGNNISGINTNSSVPTLINDEKWNSISSGEGHLCGIKSDHSLWCWGRNDSGQLGNGRSGWLKGLMTPENIGLDEWKQIATGIIHTCGIQKHNNSLWCWGSNSNKQIGANPNNYVHNQAFQVNGKWNFIDVNNSASCGIKDNGSLWCWGLLNKSLNYFYYPKVNKIDSNIWKKISLGDNHLCGIKSDDSLWCLAEIYFKNVKNNLAVNIELVNDQIEPYQVSDELWLQVSSGGNFTCAIKLDSTLWCRGTNYINQLGNESSLDIIENLTQVTESNDWKSVSAGRYHVCAIKNNGKIFCWGYNLAGQLGTGDFKNKSTP